MLSRPNFMHFPGHCPSRTMKTPKEAVRIGLVWVPTEIRIRCLAMFEQSSSHLQAARIIASAICAAKLFARVAAHLSYPIVCVCV
jgi:hypothetical protein